MVGNAAENGNVIALNLSDTGTPRCLLTQAEADKIRKGESLVRGNSAENSYVSVRPLALPQSGQNLLRVDQNWGGSNTLVRYALVSVVGDSAGRHMLFLLKILSEKIKNDKDAVKSAS
jgi:hypothetical protein